MRPLIISEIGHNHNGSMDIAFELINQAKECGADVAKFQLYDTDKLFKPDFEWYEDLKRGEITYWQWWDIVKECNKVGIDFLASVFDTKRIDWCEDVQMKRYKIASRSIYDTELLEAVVATGKPMIISLGMTDERGIPKIKAYNKVDYLYCIAKYPTPLEELKLGKVDFTRYSGFSDHTLGIEAAMVAIVKGARIIEKHFTLDKNMEGCDHAGSMEPNELKQLVEFARKYEVMN